MGGPSIWEVIPGTIPCSNWQNRTWEAAWNRTSYHWHAES